LIGKRLHETPMTPDRVKGFELREFNDHEQDGSAGWFASATDEARSPSPGTGGNGETDSNLNLPPYVCSYHVLADGVQLDADAGRIGIGTDLSERKAY
jgi:hypothetical protein